MTLTTSPNLPVPGSKLYMQGRWRPLKSSTVCHCCALHAVEVGPDKKDPTRVKKEPRAAGQTLFLAAATTPVCAASLHAHGARRGPAAAGLRWHRPGGGAVLRPTYCTGRLHLPLAVGRRAVHVAPASPPLSTTMVST